MQGMVSPAFHQALCYINKKPTGDAKLNSKKATTNKNSLSFEESARRGNIDLIFCGIHTFQFIDHSNSNQDGKELTPPFPAGGMELWLQAKLEFRQEPTSRKQAPQNR
jgi:hypothetical protein